VFQLLGVGQTGVGSPAPTCHACVMANCLYITLMETLQGCRSVPVVAVWGIGLGRLVAEIVGSNTACGMGICFCVVLSYVGRGLASGWSPCKEAYQLPKWFIIPESSSIMKQATRPNPYSWRRRKLWVVSSSLWSNDNAKFWGVRTRGSLCI
jgi:hypothetical protein